MKSIRAIFTGNRLDDLIFAMMAIFAICSCIWELPVRHAARIAIALSLLKIILYPSCLASLKEAKGILVALGAFFGMIVFETWYGGNFWLHVSNYPFKFNYNLLLVPIMLISFAGRQRLNILFLLLAASMLAMDGYIFWQSYNGVERPLAILESNPMVTATLYVMLVPAFMLMALKGDTVLKKRYYAFCSFFNIIAVFLTGTRAAWCTVGLVACFIILYYVREWKKLLAILGVMLAVLGSISYTAPYFSQRLTTVGDLAEHSQAQRLLMWQSAYNMFLDHPLLGVGIGNYEPLYQTKYISPQADEPHQQHAHSNYFHLLGECGLLGFLTYCGSFGYFMLWAFRRRDDIFGLIMFSFIASFMIYTTTDYTLYGYVCMRMLWFLLAICTAGAAAGKLRY